MATNDVTKMKQQIEQASSYLQEQFDGVDMSTARLVILGSGFRSILDDLEVVKALKLSQIPHAKDTTVVGHGSELILASHDGAPLLIQTGRIHMYEGHNPHEVVMLLRALAKAGLKRLLLTNASGSVNPELRAGELVVVNDHINLTGQSCLVASPSVAEGDTPFVDMVGSYDHDFTQWCQKELSLPTVVYGGLLGPSFETPAETKMLHRLGIDIVGMSTVQEVLAARQLAMKVGCLSLVTNMAGGLADSVNHHDVLAMSNKRQDFLRVSLQRALSFI